MTIPCRDRAEVDFIKRCWEGSGKVLVKKTSFVYWERDLYKANFGKIFLLKKKIKGQFPKENIMSMFFISWGTYSFISSSWCQLGRALLKRIAKKLEEPRWSINPHSTHCDSPSNAPF